MAVVNMNPRLEIEQPRAESTELERVTPGMPDLVDLQDFLVKFLGQVVDVNFERCLDAIGGHTRRWQHCAGFWIKP